MEFPHRKNEPQRAQSSRKVTQSFKIYLCGTLRELCGTLRNSAVKKKQYSTA